MYIIIIMLPLISGVINGLIGRKIGKAGSAWIVRITITISTILSIIGFYEILIRETQVVIEIMPMIKTEKIDVSWSIGIDTLTVIIYMPIIIVSLGVQYYSIEYMREDPHSIRYNSIISLFTFFMLVLVSGINWIIIYIGWEGVGVCSYLLINHWFKRNKANKAGIKAIIINRIGDWSIMIGIIVISIVTGNIEISTMNSIGSYINKEVITIIGILVLIGAMCKSSQFMLHTWLTFSNGGMV